ncbi:hypothetical protein T07_12592 [Trichinella nelsoni]|uniref:Uncharacterized protein n=1 Tax=Trichinella nelsoni TaxID=6336 RepID=A0A0V0RUI8_9BILA|nr:hypothetical protein T07_12592 [Trichinella nelsoni]
MLLMSWSSVVMVLLKVLNEKSSCGPRSAAKTQAVQAELTELNGGHEFQWLQTVHNYARYETHYNYNAGHFFLAPRVGQWAKVSSKKNEEEIFNNRSCVQFVAQAETDDRVPGSLSSGKRRMIAMKPNAEHFFSPPKAA